MLSESFFKYVFTVYLSITIQTDFEVCILYTTFCSPFVVLLTGLRFSTIVPGHHVCKFVYIEVLSLTLGTGCIKSTFIVTLRVLIEPTIPFILHTDNMLLRYSNACCY